MKYIKTKSSYVKQTKHSLTNDGGVIFEADNSTLGGVNLLSSTQYPIYTSGNFIISVDNTVPVKKKIEKIAWESNGDSEIWTLDNINTDVVSTDDSSSDTEITLKKDFFRLQDFAYYGSLSKFVEGSINHIIDTFPGEIYIPYLDSYETVSEEQGYVHYAIDDAVYILGEEDCTFPISNPFQVDLHTFVNTNNTEAYDYKFLSVNDNYKNYEIIDNEGNVIEIEDKPSITDINLFPCVGDKICNIDINGGLIELKAFLGDNRKVYYLISTLNTVQGYHIRPKESFYQNFLQNLTVFENYLLDKKESIENDDDWYYKSVFEIVEKDNSPEGGYISSLQTFMIPIDDSKYNIDITSSAYQLFVDTISQVAIDYDEMFTHNLYRSMTHESIKNFDWTFTRDYQDGEEEEYVIGGNRFENLMNVFGREFDEIKAYIDNINNVNIVTYDGKNNLANYFLSDYANNKGWDVYNVYPFTLSEYVLTESEDGQVECQTKKYEKHFDDLTNIKEEENTAVYNGETLILHRYFKQDEIDDEIKPYKPNTYCNTYGQFIYCDCDSKSIQRVDIGIDTYIDDEGKEQLMFDKNQSIFYSECEKKLHHRIKPYYSNDTYTMTSINNEFLKRLCLNSPNIFKYKGTIDGIEEILGMLGLKSQRWIDSLSDYQKSLLAKCDDSDYYAADYTIKEYTTFTTGIYDSYNDVKKKTWINWLNGTKLVKYDSYDNYEGLPIISYPAVDESGATTNAKILYPYFGNEIDGNPYYQMKGGWLNKGRYQFTKDNAILKEDENSSADEKLYTVTHSTNRTISYLDEISSFVADDFKDGDVMYVENLDKNYIIFDGHEFYEIYTETLLIDDTYVDYNYIILTASTDSCVVGETEFTTNLTISNPVYYYVDNKQLVDLTTIQGNANIKVYILSGDTSGDTENISREIMIKDETNDIELQSTIAYFIDGKFITYDYTPNGTYEDGETSGETESAVDEEYTNYFILHKSENCQYIIIEDHKFTDGWEQLTNNDMRYHRLAAIVEKNQGNNPHTGHNLYDMGLDYINYFSELFKYTFENDLINSDCYLGLDYDFYLRMINQIGFVNLTDQTSGSCPSHYNEHEDCKIHSFCDVITSSVDPTQGDYDENRFFRKKVGSLSTSEDLIYRQYGGDKETDYHLSGISRTNLKMDFKNTPTDCYTDDYKDDPFIINDENNKLIISGLSEITDVTYQIMNIKRVNITFNMHYSEYSKEDLEEKKYIESVVLPYLEQMLPLNIICRIDYSYSIAIKTEEITLANSKLE